MLSAAMDHQNIFRVLGSFRQAQSDIDLFETPRDFCNIRDCFQVGISNVAQTVCVTILIHI